MSQVSTIEDRALTLLTSGVTAEQCAAALGVDSSRISQLISDESFSTKLVTARFESLRKNNARDSELDALEDQIIANLKMTAGMILEPMKLARLLQVVNAAKRRGADAPAQSTQKTQVLKLNIPIAIMQKFVVNGSNQVISAGEQDLVTIQSSQMKQLAGVSDEATIIPGNRTINQVIGLEVTVPA